MQSSDEFVITDEVYPQTKSFVDKFVDNKNNGYNLFHACARHTVKDNNFIL